VGGVAGSGNSVVVTKALDLAVGTYVNGASLMKFHSSKIRKKGILIRKWLRRNKSSSRVHRIPARGKDLLRNLSLFVTPGYEK